MYANRLILETDTHGHLKQLPPLPPNVRLEVIFWVLKEHPQPLPLRKPSAKIVGHGQILGDLVTPVTTLAEWEVLT